MARIPAQMSIDSCIIGCLRRVRLEMQAVCEALPNLTWRDLHGVAASLCDFCRKIAGDLEFL